MTYTTPSPPPESVHMSYYSAKYCETIHVIWEIGPAGKLKIQKKWTVTDRQTVYPKDLIEAVNLHRFGPPTSP